MKIKRKLGRLALIALVVGGVSSTATAGIITQAGVQGVWSTGSTWVGGVAPADSVDSVVLNANIQFRNDFVLGADQTITQTAGGYFYFDNGTLDVFGSYNAARHFSAGGTGAKNLILRPGSEFSCGGAQYRVANTDFTTTWIADATGVAIVSAGGGAQLNGSAAVIDLTNYDLANGSTLVLMTANEGTHTFGSVTLLGGYTGTIDYAYNGNTQIALTNIIPEPATLGLIGTFGTGLLAIRRLFLV